MLFAAIEEALAGFCLPPLPPISAPQYYSEPAAPVARHQAKPAECLDQSGSDLAKHS